MGAWGIGPFENDGAMDWAGSACDAEPAKRTKNVLAALAAGAKPGNYLDHDAAVEAISAAELVAAALGKPHAAVLEAMKDSSGADDGNSVGEIARWASDPAHPVAELRTATTATLAVKALKAVLQSETSELAELWDEAPDGKEWRASLADLIVRVSP